MNKFREKAQAVKAAGEAERGNWAPPEFAQNAYNYWLARTNSKRGRRIREGRQKENLCQGFWVVVFWAPFMWLRRKADEVATNPIFLTVLGIALVSAFVWACLTYGSVLLVTSYIAAVLAAIAFITAGAIGGAALAVEDPYLEGLPTGTNAKMLAVIGFPFAAITYALFKLGQRIRDADKTWLENNIDKVAIVLGAVGAVAVLGSLFVAEGLAITLLFVAGVIGFVTVLGLGALGISFLGEWIAGKRRLARDKAIAELDAYLEEHGTYPPDKAIIPGPVKKFFTGLADVVVFLAQFARAKKWKVCPLLEIDVKTVGEDRPLPGAPVWD